MGRGRMGRLSNFLVPKPTNNVSGRRHSVKISEFYVSPPDPYARRTSICALLAKIFSAGACRPAPGSPYKPSKYDDLHPARRTLLQSLVYAEPQTTRRKTLRTRHCCDQE